MYSMQSGASPESRTLQDLWSLHPASGPPLCLVGSLFKRVSVIIIWVNLIFNMFGSYFMQKPKDKTKHKEDKACDWHH